MDKRREPRFVADQSVTITVFRDPAIAMPAKVQNFSGRGLGLKAPAPVPPGTAVKIEMEDSIVLGETAYCRQDPDGWFIGVELNQMLAGLAELGRRLQEFSGAPSGRQTVHASDQRDAQNR